MREPLKGCAQTAISTDNKEPLRAFCRCSSPQSRIFGALPCMDLYAMSAAKEFRRNCGCAGRPFTLSRAGIGQEVKFHERKTV